MLSLLATFESDRYTRATLFQLFKRNEKRAKLTRMKRTIELNKQTKRLGLIERIQRKRKEQKADVAGLGLKCIKQHFGFQKPNKRAIKGSQTLFVSTLLRWCLK